MLFINKEKKWPFLIKHSLLLIKSLCGTTTVWVHKCRSFNLWAIIIYVLNSYSIRRKVWHS